MDRYAKPFLLYGRMPLPLIADPPMRAGVSGAGGGRVGPPPREFEVPLVIQSVWEDRHGGVAVFAVNTLDRPATVEVAPPGDGPWQATCYTGSAQHDERSVSGPGAPVLALGPGRLEAVVFRGMD